MVTSQKSNLTSTATNISPEQKYALEFLSRYSKEFASKLTISDSRKKDQWQAGNQGAIVLTAKLPSYSSIEDEVVPLILQELCESKMRKNFNEEQSYMQYQGLITEEIAKAIAERVPCPGSASFLGKTAG